MYSSSLLMAQITRLRRELPLIESSIATLLAHTRFMSTATNLEPRHLSEIADDSTRVAQRLRERLIRTIDEAQSVLRSVPRAPVLGPTQSSMNVRDISAFMRRLPESMSALEDALRSFRAEADQRMNDLGRSGYLMVEGSSVHLWWSVMNSLLELWSLERRRRNLR